MSKKIERGSLSINIIIGLIVFVIIIIFIAISGGIFVGIGYIFSLILPLTLFQSTLLLIGATLVSVFTIHSIANYRSDNYFEDDYEEDEDDYEENENVIDEDEDKIEKKKNVEKELKRDFTVINKNKIGRNELCHCGSGKKYKYCCGK